MLTSPRRLAARKAIPTYRIARGPLQQNRAPRYMPNPPALNGVRPGVWCRCEPVLGVLFSRERDRRRFHRGCFRCAGWQSVLAADDPLIGTVDGLTANSVIAQVTSRGGGADWPS